MKEIPILKFELKNLRYHVSTALIDSLDELELVIDEQVASYLTPERLQLEISKQIDHVFADIIHKRLTRCVERFITDNSLQIKWAKEEERR